MSQRCWGVTNLVSAVLIPFLIPCCWDNGVLPQSIHCIFGLAPVYLTVGWTRKQRDTRNIQTVLRSAVSDKGIRISLQPDFFSTEFWKPHCNLKQKNDSSVSQSPLWEADKLVGALDAKIAWEMEDTLALPPHLTFGSLKKNVYIKCSELSIQMPGNNLWTMTHQSNVLWTGGGCLYKCCPSGGEISTMLHLFFCGEMAVKRKKEVHRKT